MLEPAESQLPDLLNTQELAALLRLNAHTIQNWRYLDIGPRFLKLGKGKRGKVLYRRADVQAWLDGKRMGCG